MNHRRLAGTRRKHSRGFSTLELLLVMVVSLIIAALAIPRFDQVRRTLRISGDARDLNGAINQAKLMAAADFTDARVFIDLGFNQANTYHVDVWNKNGLAPNVGCWQVVGDSRPCYVAGASPVQRLSPGVSFGFGGVGGPPPATQTLGISQAPNCLPWNGKKVGWVVSTACIWFSSRGMPVDAAGNPVGNDAVYITDNAQTYGVTIAATGLSQLWANNINANGNNGNGWYRK